MLGRRSCGRIKNENENNCLAIGKCYLKSYIQLCDQVMVKGTMPKHSGHITVNPSGIHSPNQIMQKIKQHVNAINDKL